MIPKLLKRDLRKMGACSSGRAIFGQFFYRGIELTYDNMLKVCAIFPTRDVYWFLRNIMGDKVARRYDDIVYRCIERVDVHGSNWDKENRHIARWLLKTLTKYFEEGGDLTVLESELYD